MENIDLIKQYIQSLNQAVTTLDPQIITLTSESFEDRINSESDPLKRVKIATNYAYTIVTLAFAYLKSIGVDTAKHPIMEDLNRVKSYMKRYKDASSGVDEEEQKRIDTEKAKRFINAALGNNQQSNLNTTTSSMAQPAISTHTKFAADDEKKEDKKEEEEEETKTKSQAKQIRNEFKSDKLQKISKAGNATGKNLKKGKFTPKSNKK
ncbi:hypothetical protein WICPIJ_007052 [Wickerhamomyces pijperi]|uniref:Exosome complex protein n=1 Tax=Wickerhamomyces pijperi TaxID=599730 RepID=A0A9P8TKT8_WICPI|nr:hypothetical protein WICPIJ_007052 [Wickerhamomyces pijperi]